MTVRILVVDDQAAVREALAAMLELEEQWQLRTAANGQEAIDYAENEPPDVVLMDIHMPVLDGITATRCILQKAPTTAVVVLTTFDDDETILAALRAGALGYLTKDAGRAQIIQAVRAALLGQSVLDRAVQSRVLGLISHAAVVADKSPQVTSGDGIEQLDSGKFAQLTPRERQILGLIAQGLRNQEIAAELFVTEATVKTHINNLFAKLGLRSRAEAVRYVLADAEHF